MIIKTNFISSLIIKFNKFSENFEDIFLKCCLFNNYCNFMEIVQFIENKSHKIGLY